MRHDNDRRVVLTLDAGGTNFVFTAIRGNREIIAPLTYPANANDLQKCLNNISTGFKACIERINEKPTAISFAFPGPADYANGIIGNLENLPAFKGGVALGPQLQDTFQLPVFINNDGNLFSLGESIAGLLPHINHLLSRENSPKRFSNLFGITLGTGFGGGIVINNRMVIGDNSAAGEINRMWLQSNPQGLAEESISIRGLKKLYLKAAGIGAKHCPEPKTIHDIATWKKEGNQQAASSAFKKLGQAIGDALANSITLIDGLVVIGGGLAAAYRLFLPEVIGEMNRMVEGVPRMEIRAYNLEDEDELKIFIKGDRKKIKIPGRDQFIYHDSMQRMGIGVSRLGTSRAVAIGAYAFALNSLDNN